MADQEQPTLPGADDKKQATKRTHATLDEREAELNRREEELQARSASMNPQGFESRPARVSTDQVAQQKEHGRDSKASRRQMGQPKRLDADKYLEIHQAKKLFWVNDLSGDVQRWIDMGAEPVPVADGSGRSFEGITDKVESKWVRAMGGSDGEGNYFWVYLLMMEPELYHEVKVAPIEERQDLIRRAIKAGGDQSDVGPGGPKLPSYAPNLPTGDTGINEQRETVA